MSLLAYAKTTWVDDAAPPVNAANLNKLEQGIYDVTNEVIAQTPKYVTLAQFAALVPYDSQEVYLVVDATNCVVWHLRYNNGSASSYKWEYLGGGPVRIDATGGSTSSTSYIDIAASSFVLPRAGDYDILFGSSIYNSASTTNNFVSLKKGSAVTSDNDGLSHQNMTVIQNLSLARTIQYLGAAASDTVKLQARTLAGTMFWGQTFMRITPVRIS